MKITDKIENYESMTPEEKLAALEALELEESNDNKLKDALNKATSQAAEYKKLLRDKQTEAERLEAERKEEAEKKDAMLAELIKEKTVAEHKANFLKEGYSDELANKSAVALADGDYNTVFASLNSFITERDKKLKVVKPLVLAKSKYSLDITSQSSALTKRVYPQIEPKLSAMTGIIYAATLLPKAAS